LWDVKIDYIIPPYGIWLDGEKIKQRLKLFSHLKQNLKTDSNNLYNKNKALKTLYCTLGLH
jgi:hypothetical protein